MMTPYLANSSKMIVFSSILLTMAIVACDQLEKAGMPAFVYDDPSGYVVVVPNDCAEESTHLLEGEPHFGEIYLYQK